MVHTATYLAGRTWQRLLLFSSPIFSFLLMIRWVHFHFWGWKVFRLVTQFGSVRGPVTDKRMTYFWFLHRRIDSGGAVFSHQEREGADRRRRGQHHTIQWGNALLWISGGHQRWGMVGSGTSTQITDGESYTVWQYGL